MDGTKDGYAILAVMITVAVACVAGRQAEDAGLKRAQMQANAERAGICSSSGACNRYIVRSTPHGHEYARLISFRKDGPQGVTFDPVRGTVRIMGSSFNDCLLGDRSCAFVGRDDRARESELRRLCEQVAKNYARYPRFKRVVCG